MNPRSVRRTQSKTSPLGPKNHPPDLPRSRSIGRGYYFPSHEDELPFPTPLPRRALKPLVDNDLGSEDEDDAAIEIRLEDTGLMKISAGNTTNVAGTPQRKSNSVLKRFFKGSPGRTYPKSPAPPKIASVPESQAIDEFEDDWGQPSPFHDWSTPVKQNPTFQDHDNFDTFSSMSDLSGSKATTVMYSRPPPVQLNRQESLGVNSIKDIRNSLKVMEEQLGQLSHNGERVSRQKVMNALLTVADSLEDTEEREHLRKELDGRLGQGGSRSSNSSYRTPESLYPMDETSENEPPPKMVTPQRKLPEKCSKPPSSPFNIFSSSPQRPEEKAPSSPFNIFSSVGKMFNVLDTEQYEMEKALG